MGNKLTKWWNDIRELWYYSKADYFIERFKIEDCEPPSKESSIVKVIKESMYCKFHNDTKQFDWVPAANNASVFGFWLAVFVRYAMKKKFKGTGYEFSISPTGDVAFIHHVTTGRKLKIENK